MPGKILLDLAGKAVLWRVIERVKKTKKLERVVIATTTNRTDDIVAALAAEMGVDVFRGSENNVLERYYLAAKHFKATHIVRITSDCPLIDPATIDEVVETHLSAGNDYTSNTLERTYPRGLDTEVFSFKALERAHQKATLQPEIEHVTYYIYTHRDQFRVANVAAPPHLRRPQYRLCVDEPDDYRLIKRIYEEIKDSNGIIDIRRVIEFLDGNPKIASMNAHVDQKKE